MKKILGTLVVVALVLGSSSALAAPARASQAVEVRQAADRAIEGPTFIRALLDSADRMWDSIVKAVGNQDREASARMEQENTSQKQNVIISVTTTQAVGSQD